MTLPTEELLTLSEVAELARVAPATIVAWAKDDRNDFTGVRVGRQWRFPRGATLLFLGLKEAS